MKKKIILILVLMIVVLFAMSIKNYIIEKDEKEQWIISLHDSARETWNSLNNLNESSEIDQEEFLVQVVRSSQALIDLDYTIIEGRKYISKDIVHPGSLSLRLYGESMIYGGVINDHKLLPMIHKETLDKKEREVLLELSLDIKKVMYALELETGEGVNTGLSIEEINDILAEFFDKWGSVANNPFLLQ